MRPPVAPPRLPFAPSPGRRGRQVAPRSSAAAGLALGLALGVGALPGAVLAERADRLKPMNIEADAGRFDDARQIGRFTGNVLITKGSIELRAAQVEVRQGPDGQQSSVATGAAGSPATFRQKREGLDETLQGEALRIEYDARTDTLRFVDEAVLRRFRGAVLADEARGQLITFDNAASVFSVTGGGNGAGGDGRVRMILSPRDAPSADAAPPSTAGSPTGSPAAPPPSGTPGAAPVRR